MMAGKPISHRYGRMLADFHTGETYLHPWEVTLDDGLAAFYAASFQDAAPLWASRSLARALGFRDRPVHPLLCLNLALSFSVHDVSEQAIAHLAYVDIRFPHAAYPGATVQARSTVIEAKPSSSGDKGVVHVATTLADEDGRVVCAFERKALIRGGSLASRPAIPGVEASASQGARDPGDGGALPPELREPLRLPPGARPFAGLPGAFDDFRVGQVYAHAIGKTVGESEHMQLTALMRNSHPLHFDELYCREHSFTKTRVVYGGLVFGWIAALASRDVAGHSLWEAGYEAGAHPAAVAAGDTLYALSKVISTEDRGSAGVVGFALVGVKNVTAEAAFAKHGDALFVPELGKKEGQGVEKVPEKVFEIKRRLLVRRRGL
jgi:2-methylfumaryl-CoA hydratase